MSWNFTFWTYIKYVFIGDVWKLSIGWTHSAHGLFIRKIQFIFIFLLIEIKHILLLLKFFYFVFLIQYFKKKLLWMWLWRRKVMNAEWSTKSKIKHWEFHCYLFLFFLTFLTLLLQTFIPYSHVFPPSHLLSPYYIYWSKNNFLFSIIFFPSPCSCHSSHILTCSSSHISKLLFINMSLLYLFQYTIDISSKNFKLSEDCCNWID